MLDRIVWARTVAKVKRYARRNFACPDDADDFAGDVLLAVVARLHAYDSSKYNFYSWVGLVQRSVLIDHMRHTRTRSHMQYVALPDHMSIEASHTDWPLPDHREAFWDSILRTVLHNKIHTEIVRLRYRDGIPCRHIAVRLGMTPHNVVRKLMVAKKKLKKNKRHIHAALCQ